MHSWMLYAGIALIASGAIISLLANVVMLNLIWNEIRSLHQFDLNQTDAVNRINSKLHIEG